MGMGDEIMATGQVKRIHARTGNPVMIVGRDGRGRWSPIFDGNPKIATGAAQSRAERLVNGPNARPYIAGKTAKRWTWQPFAIEAGEIFLTDSERAWAATMPQGSIMVEPNVKANGHANKAWRFDRWQAVVDALGADRFVQCGPPGTRWLERVTRVETLSFRHACALMSVSRGFVGTEGGLHHAAAALCVPAVVLWSEFISPEITGYPSQWNIRHADGPCGSRVPCMTCDESMRAITVGEVVDGIVSRILIK